MENTVQSVILNLHDTRGGITAVEIAPDGTVCFDVDGNSQDGEYECWFLPEELALINRLSQAVKIQGEVGW